MSALAGAWFVELYELGAMPCSEVEVVKSFISRRVDRYRPAYGQHVLEANRQMRARRNYQRKEISQGQD